MLDKSPTLNVPNDLAAFWMPFTANRAFKNAPRLLAGAKDMHYITVDGPKIIDGAAGMWCCNAGHARPRIIEAVQRQVATMDFAPTFQMGHPLPFVLAERLAAIAPLARLGDALGFSFQAVDRIGADLRLRLRPAVAPGAA